MKSHFSHHYVRVARKQFPIALTFAGNVHRGQEKTLNKLKMNLRFTFFSPRQFKVALSPVKKSTNILLLPGEDHTLASATTIHNLLVPVVKFGFGRGSYICPVSLEP